MVLFWWALLGKMAAMAKAVAASKAAGAVGGAAKAVGGAAQGAAGALGGGGGQASPEPPRAAIGQQTPQMPPPQQGPSFGKQIASGYLDNYMASQGIDMKGGFKEGLKGYAKRWAGLSPQEREQQATPAQTAPDDADGKLSDFVGTVQSVEAKRRKGLPY